MSQSKNSTKEPEQTQEPQEEVEEINADEIVEPVISAVDSDGEEAMNDSSNDGDDDDEDDDDDEGEDDDDDEEGSETMSAIENKVAIDLSDNDYYKGLCTLLEDEHGNNILEYISLLHTELIGVNKNLRNMRKEMNRMANCAEIMVKKSS
jgi:hypothetical protein